MPEPHSGSPPAAAVRTPQSTPIKTTPFSPSAFLNSPATVNKQLTASTDPDQSMGPTYTSTPRLVVVLLATPITMNYYLMFFLSSFV